MYGELIKTISSGHNDIKLVINSNIKQTRHQYNHKKNGRKFVYTKRNNTGENFLSRGNLKKNYQENILQNCVHRKLKTQIHWVVSQENATYQNDLRRQKSLSKPISIEDKENYPTKKYPAPDDENLQKCGHLCHVHCFLRYWLS